MEDYKMSEQLIATPSVFGENGNFLLEREIGSGGMGGVYMGRDKMLDRQVAVKVMLREFGSDAEFVEKFKKEAQSAARLIHPNIAQIYSYGICDGMPYIAMELASGGSLYSIMNNAKGQTNIARVLKICQQVAQALQCASDQGFVHGDVKPENILLDANGNAKLVDFGLAGMQKDTDEIWGTPYYISPEKVRKEAVDFRADMYCLGGTLYHALTGVAPFEGEDSVAVVKKRFEGSPKKPSEIRPEISPAIDKLVLTMLEFDKEKRYPSFEALLLAFSEVLSSGLTRTGEISAAAAVKSSAPAKKSAARPMTRGSRAMMMKKRSSVSKIKPIRPEGDSEISVKEEEEEENENIAGKIALFVIGAIVVLGLVIGGLIWFKVADQNARERERQTMIVNNISKARGAIAETREAAANFEKEFIDFAKKATEECEMATKELSKLVPDAAEFLKIPPTKELLDAISSTNKVVEAAVSNAAPAAVAAPVSTNAVVSTNAPAEQAAQPAAPEKKLPQVVNDMHEIWERAYSCQASIIRITVLAAKVQEICAKADSITESTEEAMKALGEISISAKSAYDEMTAAKDVENVRKGIAYVKSRGKKMIEQTVKRLRIEKLEADRKAKADAAAAAEAERQKKLAEERKALIESEIQAIKEKFVAVTEQGCFRQLDWKTATRLLNNVKETFKTAEGTLAAEIELRKVESMKSVQDIFIEKLKGHTFKGKLKGAKVVDISEKEIKIKKPDGRLMKLSWSKFYRDYPGNLNEVINHYIVNGRRNSNLNLMRWTNAMVGSALTMQLVCSEVNGAIERAQQLVKETIVQFPEFAKVAKLIFPDVELEVKAEE